jgi:hypothetical protein
MPGRLTASFALLAVLSASCGGGGGGGGGDPVDPPLPFLALSSHQAAAVVVGQPGPSSGTANAGGGAPGAVGLRFPVGAAAGGLFVPDTENHRVLGFSGVPSADGTAASFVLGQSDFTHGVANDDDQNGTTDAAPTGRTLSSPAKVVVAAGRLFVADTANHRVLIWDRIPTSSFAPADHVVGQSTLGRGVANDDDQNGSTDPAPTARTLSHPFGLAVADGRLYVADENNHRVVIWDSIPRSNFVPADRVLGQQDFTSNSQGTSDVEFRFPTDVAVGGGRLFVADSSNHRVMVWNTAPPPFGLADWVVGQPGFVTAIPGAGPGGLSFPSALHASDSQLFVCDYGNNRVLVFDTLPASIQPPADRVLGQSTFTNTQPNDDDQNGIADASPSARTMSGPFGVAGFANRLYVTDQLNHRVLIYQGP